MSIEVLLIFSILGITSYGLILKFFKWDKKYEPFFWITVFAPLFLVNMADFDNERIKNAVYAFFGSIIVMEVMRNKLIQRAREAEQRKGEVGMADKKLYKEPKKKRIKRSKSKKTKTK